MVDMTQVPSVVRLHSVVPTVSKAKVRSHQLGLHLVQPTHRELSGFNIDMISLQYNDCYYCYLKHSILTTILIPLDME